MTRLGAMRNDRSGLRSFPAMATGISGAPRSYAARKNALWNCAMVRDPDRVPSGKT